MRIKKTIVWLVLVTAVLLPAGCGRQAGGRTAAPEVVHIAAMKGPTGMGIAAYAAEEAADPDSIVDLEILTMPEDVATGLAKGELDIAAIPANLAANLYQKTEGAIQVAAINVTNVLYIVENGSSIQSAADLEGKTLYSTGKGATPEASLTILLDGLGLTPGDDVFIEFSAEATEVAARLTAEEGAVALLPEPFLTSVLMKDEGVSVRLSLGELWKEQNGTDSEIVTGVVVARKAFIEQHPDWFSQFLDDYQASTDYVNEQPAEAALQIEALEIIGAAVAEQAIPNAGLSFVRGDSMKAALERYIGALHDFDPQLVGGALPDDDFYYTRTG